MLEYYIRERCDLNNEGATVQTYEVRSRGSVDLEQLAGIVHKHFHFIPQAELKGIAEDFIDEISNLLAQGYSVSLGALGNFAVRIGERKTDDEEGAATDAGEQKTKSLRRNSRSLCVTGLRFSPNKQFLKELRLKSKPVSEGSGVRTLQRSPYTRNERIQLAIEYLQEHSVMRLSNYVELTRLSRSTASKELRELCADRKVPISSNGAGAGKVYVLNQPQTSGA